MSNTPTRPFIGQDQECKRRRSANPSSIGRKATTQLVQLSEDSKHKPEACRRLTCTSSPLTAQVLQCCLPQLSHRIIELATQMDLISIAINHDQPVNMTHPCFTEPYKSFKTAKQMDTITILEAEIFLASVHVAIVY